MRAVTGVLQGIATGEATQAAVGGLSPYANQAIKQLTTDSNTGEVNTQANLMAHALLGAVEAYAAGNNATTGAAGAVGGELAAKIITEQLYQKHRAADGGAKTNGYRIKPTCQRFSRWLD